MSDFRLKFWNAAAAALSAGLAAFFIFHHLGLSAFWLDEAGPANLIRNSWSAIPAKAALDGCPILYAFLLKAWAGVFGESGFALRSFSGVFGVAVVVAIAPIARRLFRDDATGLFTGFLAATNFFLLYFATKTRAYTLSALAGLLAQYFFIRFALSARKRDGVLYLACAVPALYLHPWLFLAFGAQILSGFYFRRFFPSYKKLAAVQAAVLLGALPNIAVTLYQSRLNANAWMEKPTLRNLAEVPVNLTFGSSWIYLALVVAAGIACWMGKRRTQPSFPELAFVRGSLAFYLVLPPVAAWIISQLSPAYVAARYEMIVLPAFLLLAGHAAAALKRAVPVVLLLGALLTFAAWTSVRGDEAAARRYVSDDRTAVRDLLQRVREGDAVVTTDLSYSTAQYYFRRLNTGPEAIRFDLFCYPEVIKSHPSWSGVHTKQAALPYKDEARRLALSLKERTRSGYTVWVLSLSGHPMSDMLKEVFSSEFLLSRTVTLPVPRQNSWFDEILIFRR